MSEGLGHSVLSEGYADRSGVAGVLQFVPVGGPSPEPLSGEPDGGDFPSGEYSGGLEPAVAYGDDVSGMLYEGGSGASFGETWGA